MILRARVFAGAAASCSSSPPRSSSALGVPVLFQAMGYFVSRGELSLSNPATVILR